MSNRARVEQVLQQFNKEYPRPEMGEVSLSDPYDLETDWPDKQWPSSDQAGVYAFFSPNEELIYIGKASCGRALGSRLGDYFQHGENRTARPVDTKAVGVRFVATVCVPAGHEFEAPAIEEYLIRECDPPRNQLARKRSPDRG